MKSIHLFGNSCTNFEVTVKRDYVVFPLVLQIGPQIAIPRDRARRGISIDGLILKFNENMTWSRFDFTLKQVGFSKTAIVLIRIFLKTRALFSPPQSISTGSVIRMRHG